MRKALLFLIAAVIVGSGSAALADTSQPSVKDGKAAVATAIEKFQQSFYGHVKKSGNGLVLETKDGDYILKGLSLDEIVGKDAYVTGVVKSETSTIYVVKANVKE